MAIEHSEPASDHARSIGDPKAHSASRIVPTTCSDAPTRQRAVQLWRMLGERLLEWNANWQSLVETPKNIPPAPMARFDQLSDEVIFEAFATAAISGNARWDRIASIQHELAEPFQDFSPDRFAALTERHIDEWIVPWFRQRRAGSARLPSVLKRLRGAAEILAPGRHGDARSFLMDASDRTEGSPENLAVLLGTDRRYKMPGFGIALAAEALRLLGCDVCKPDRHVLRAVAAWQFVRFKNWPHDEFAAPHPRTPELLATMLAVREIARAVGVSTSYATSVIWLAGSVSGARLTNQELARLKP